MYSSQISFLSYLQKQWAIGLVTYALQTTWLCSVKKTFIFLLQRSAKISEPSGQHDKSTKTAMYFDNISHTVQQKFFL